MSAVPVTCFQRSATAFCTAMPPPTASFSAREVELGEIRVVEQRVEQRVDAGDDGVLVLRQLLDEARDVARVGDQHVLAADHHHHQAVHRQREDVIERQRGDDHRPLGRRIAGASQALYCSSAAMTLRCSSIAPLETPVVPPVYCRKAMSSCAQERRDERLAGAFGQRLLEAHGARQVVGGHHLLHLAHHQVHDHALEAEHLAERGDDDVLDRACVRAPAAAPWRSSRGSRSPRRRSPSAGARARAACRAG